MAFIKVEKCAIRGISGCVPSQVEENIDLPFYSSKEEAEQVIAATGIERRHVSPKDITASDLCLKAAEKLIQESLNSSIALGFHNHYRQPFRIKADK